MIGKTIGHIRITDILGSGGMGDVYVGFDDTLKRKVAVKAIGSRFRLDPQAKARFLREARVLSQLDHPNICQIYDYIEGDESDFLVLEFIEGRSLRIAINEGLEKSQKLRIAEQIAQVMAIAHEKGVVHRDLKPSNIMLTKDNAIKVLDFGLARVVEPKKNGAEPIVKEVHTSLLINSKQPPEIGDLTLTIPQAQTSSEKVTVLSDLADEPLKTKHGTVMGTLLYMSPEQARGEDVSAASDMYSFGLLLQELFTEQEPYVETDDASTLFDNVIKAETRPVLGLSADLATLINRLKAPVPSARPSATEAAEKLQRIIEKPKKRIRNVIIGSVILAFILLGFKYTLDLRRERKQALQSRDEATNVVNFLVDLFEVSDPGEARGNTITAREILTRGAKEIEQNLERQPLTKARLMDTIGTVYRNLGLYDDSEPLLKRSLEIRENLKGKEDTLVAESLRSIALLYEQQGKFSEAESHAKRSLEIREKILDSRDPDIAESLHLLARIYYRLAKLDDAEQLYKRALDIRENALGPNHLDVAESLNDLGILYYIHSKFDESEQCYKRALEIRESVLGDDHPDVGRTLNALAGLYLWQKRYAEAEPLFQRSLAIRQKTLGPDHPDVANSYNNIAILHLYQRNYKESEAFYKKSLDIRRKSLREDHPAIAGVLEDLAYLYQETGRSDEAEALLTEALRILEKAYGADNPQVTSVLESLSYIYMDKGRYSDAEEYIKRCLAITKKAFGPDHTRVAPFLISLGKLYLQTGEDKKSEIQYKNALSIMEKAIDANERIYLEAHSGLGQMYCKAGKLDKAEQHFREALQIIENDPDTHFSETEITIQKYADMLRKMGRDAEAVALESRMKSYIKK